MIINFQFKVVKITFVMNLIIKWETLDIWWKVMTFTLGIHCLECLILACVIQSLKHHTMEEQLLMEDIVFQVWNRISNMFHFNRFILSDGLDLIRCNNCRFYFIHDEITGMTKYTERLSIRAGLDIILGTDKSLFLIQFLETVFKLKVVVILELLLNTSMYWNKHTIIPASLSKLTQHVVLILLLLKNTFIRHLPGISLVAWNPWQKNMMKTFTENLWILLVLTM